MSALSSAAVTIEDGEITIAADLLRVPPPPGDECPLSPEAPQSQMGRSGPYCPGHETY